LEDETPLTGVKNQAENCCAPKRKKKKEGYAKGKRIPHDRKKNQATAAPPDKERRKTIQGPGLSDQSIGQSTRTKTNKFWDDPLKERDKGGRRRKSNGSQAWNPNARIRP